MAPSSPAPTHATPAATPAAVAATIAPQTAPGNEVWKYTTEGVGGIQTCRGETSGETWQQDPTSKQWKKVDSAPIKGAWPKGKADPWGNKDTTKGKGKAEKGDTGKGPKGGKGTAGKNTTGKGKNVFTPWNGTMAPADWYTRNWSPSEAPVVPMPEESRLYSTLVDTRFKTFENRTAFLETLSVGFEHNLQYADIEFRQAALKQIEIWKRQQPLGIYWVSYDYTDKKGNIFVRILRRFGDNQTIQQLLDTQDITWYTDTYSSRAIKIATIDKEFLYSYSAVVNTVTALPTKCLFLVKLDLAVSSQEPMLKWHASNVGLPERSKDPTSKFGPIWWSRGESVEQQFPSQGVFRESTATRSEGENAMAQKKAGLLKYHFKPLNIIYSRI